MGSGFDRKRSQSRCLIQLAIKTPWPSLRQPPPPRMLKAAVWSQPEADDTMHEQTVS